MKRILTLLAFLLALNLVVGAKTPSKKLSKKEPICLTVHAENGSIKQSLNEDGTIKCIINPNDVIRVSVIFMNGEDVTNLLENNVLLLPAISQNTTLEICFEDIPTPSIPVYNTIAMNQ